MYGCLWASLIVQPANRKTNTPRTIMNRCDATAPHTQQRIHEQVIFISVVCPTIAVVRPHNWIFVQFNCRVRVEQVIPILPRIIGGILSICLTAMVKHRLLCSAFCHSSRGMSTTNSGVRIC